MISVTYEYKFNSVYTFFDRIYLENFCRIAYSNSINSSQERLTLRYFWRMNCFKGKMNIFNMANDINPLELGHYIIDYEQYHVLYVIYIWS